MAGAMKLLLLAVLILMPAMMQASTNDDAGISLRPAVTDSTNMPTANGIDLSKPITANTNAVTSDYVPAFGNREFTKEDTYRMQRNLTASTGEAMSAAFDLQRYYFSFTPENRGRELNDLEIINNSSGSTTDSLAIILARIGGIFAVRTTWLILFVCFFIYIVRIVIGRSAKH